ncbi:MAG: NADH-quinone oxidoreductase subunit J [Gemmatimonadaceae bacterium]
MTPEVDLPLAYTFAFYLFGIVAVASALAFVTRKSPVAAALWLVNTMFALAALYVMLDAQFIGVIQVLVYAGAIMVVFLFVIMLLNLGQPSELSDARGLRWKLTGAGLGLALLAQIFALAKARTPASLTPPPEAIAASAERSGVIGSVAAPLFTTYLLAFEVTSILLLAAVVGAVVLGRQGSDAR